MASMLACTVLLAIVFVCGVEDTVEETPPCYGVPSSLTVGRKDVMDRLLVSARFSVPASPNYQFDFKQEYPSQPDIRTRVSYVQVDDLKKDGTNGCVSLPYGGIGTPEVVIRFVSQNGTSMDFFVIVFGH